MTEHNEVPDAPHTRVTSRLAQQWTAMRTTERHPPPPPAAPRPVAPHERAQVPYGVELAAGWSWRILVIAAAAALFGWLISFFAVIVIPVVVALLITALVVPVVEWLTAHGVRRSLAAILVVLTTIAGVGALLTFAGQQVATGATDLADQTVQGLQEIRDWLKDGPLNASEGQIQDYIDRVQKAIADQTEEGGAVKRLTEVGTCLLYTSPSPRDGLLSRMPSSA